MNAGDDEWSSDTSYDSQAGSDDFAGEPWEASRDVGL